MSRFPIPGSAHSATNLDPTDPSASNKVIAIRSEGAGGETAAIPEEAVFGTNSTA